MQKGIIVMKILVFGNKNSEWLAQFFEHCIRRQDEVFLFAESSSDDIYFDVFYKDNIQIIDLEKEDNNNFNTRSLWKRQKVVKKYLNILKQYGPFDVINVQYVTDLSSLLAVALKRKETKLIYSYWGSDLLRVRKVFLLRIKSRIKKGDWVTFDNIDLQDKFNEVYGKSYTGRMECAYFGVQTLDDIETVNKSCSKQQIKEEWKVPQDKICIAVGYNGIIQQQHLKVLESISRMSKADQDKIFLVVQMTYGGTEMYKASVIEKLKALGLPYKVFLDYLSGEEVAKIRLITDIYINAQTTDAFSGSVCENLYCGNLLVNADWLNYKELVQHNLKFISFMDFENLTQVLEECLKGTLQIDISENKEKIASLRLWEECEKRWYQILYEKEY